MSVQLKDKITEMDPEIKFACPLCTEEFLPEEKHLLQMHMRAVHLEQMIALHRQSTSKPPAKKINLCFVLGCNEATETKPVTFFSLPRRPRALVWLINAGRYDMLNTPVELYGHYKICSRHFDVSDCADTLKTKLLARAVPTIFTHSLEIMGESPENEGAEGRPKRIVRHPNSLTDQFNDTIISERGSRTKKFSITVIPVDEATYSPREIKSKPHTKVFKAGNKALIYTLLQGQDKYRHSDDKFKYYFKYRYRSDVQRPNVSAKSKADERSPESFEDNSGYDNEDYHIYSLEDIDPLLNQDDYSPDLQLREEVVSKSKETGLPKITMGNAVPYEHMSTPDPEVIDISDDVGLVDETLLEHDYSSIRLCSMSTLCRLCAKELQNPDEKSVLDVLQSLHPFFQKCLNLSQDFKEGDRLPEKFCSLCVEKLQMCDSIFQQIAETNVKLKSYLSLAPKNAASNDTSKIVTFEADEKLKEDQHTTLVGGEVTNERVTLHGLSEEPCESYVCGECPRSKVYKTLMDLRCHKILVHEIDKNISERRRKEYSCKYCRKKFMSLKEFYHHPCKYQKRPNRPERPPVQRILKTVYTRRYKKHADGYLCCQCDYIAPNENDIKTHWRSHLPSLPPREPRQYRKKEPMYGCHICRRRFVSEKHLNRHLELHPKWKCKTCGKLFKNGMLLYSHKQRHEPDSARLCYLCGNMYANLGQHMRNVHNPSSKPKTICHMCGEVLASRRYLKRHIARVHEYVDKRIPCPHCQKPSRDEFALKKHIYKVHGTPRHFACLLCDMRYKRPVSLMKHIDKQHPTCDICQRQFVTKDAKIQHMDAEHNNGRNCEPSFITEDIQVGKDLDEETIYHWEGLQTMSATNIHMVLTTRNEPLPSNC